jgi:hypothetical protein
MSQAIQYQAILYQSILRLSLCFILSASFLLGCKEKKRSEVTDIEPKTQFGKAVHAAESLRDEIGHKSDEINDVMNEASSDE